ncbi:hypothetical protein BDZ88DRAFT_426270 [Geranomyces variabilis]|nr:hypothetical protein BDZ88DRAFT_426270 [Geranomyces variabilis]
MESTLDEVAKHCHIPLLFYTQCVEKNPQNWETACQKEKEAVTHCAEENVQSLRLVKKHCAAQISAYQQCLNANTSNPSACVGALKELYGCHAAVGRGIAAAAGGNEVQE